MIQPPGIMSIRLTETRYCANTRCLIQHTVQVEGVDVSQCELDQEFRSKGWRLAPGAGGHFCPVHAR